MQWDLPAAPPLPSFPIVDADEIDTGDVPSAASSSSTTATTATTSTATTSTATTTTTTTTTTHNHTPEELQDFRTYGIPTLHPLPEDNNQLWKLLESLQWTVVNKPRKKVAGRGKESDNYWFEPNQNKKLHEGRKCKGFRSFAELRRHISRVRKLLLEAHQNKNKDSGGDFDLHATIKQGLKTVMNMEKANKCAIANAVRGGIRRRTARKSAIRTKAATTTTKKSSLGKRTHAFPVGAKVRHCEKTHRVYTIRSLLPHLRYTLELDDNRSKPYELPEHELESLKTTALRKRRQVVSIVLPVNKKSGLSAKKTIAKKNTAKQTTAQKKKMKTSKKRKSSSSSSSLSSSSSRKKKLVPFTVKTLRASLVEFYAKHNADKVSMVDGLIATYLKRNNQNLQATVEIMFADIVKKYNVPPPTRPVASTSSSSSSSSPSHVAVDNETPKEIAMQHGISVTQLLRLNSHIDGLFMNSTLYAGTELLLPPRKNKPRTSTWSTSSSSSSSSSFSITPQTGSTTADMTDDSDIVGGIKITSSLHAPTPTAQFDPPVDAGYTEEEKQEFLAFAIPFEPIPDDNDALWDLLVAIKWTKITEPRKSANALKGIGILEDHYWYAPGRDKRFRSLNEVRRYLRKQRAQLIRTQNARKGIFPSQKDMDFEKGPMERKTRKRPRLKLKFIGQRISKYFINANGENQVYYGTIKSMERSHEEDGGSGAMEYLCIYDDDDSEELSETQVLQGIALFNAEKKSNNSKPPPIPIGTRKAGCYGCGRCRWYPTGCVSCRAMDYVSPPPKPMPAGQVNGKVHPSQTLSSTFEIVSGSRQSDATGYGIIAQRFISKRETFVDNTALYISKPSVYAKAHLGPEDYVSCGRMGYFQVREETLQHVAMTYFTNMAGYTQQQRDNGQLPNIVWRKTEKKYGGGLPELSWIVVKDIQKGEEILVDYNSQI